ncbi:uncharacterized protein LOC115926449 [Strongylocentrotus purpuratus]|uniref:Reverse transcriptase domain-containing protein n=1 Tax=Strongylocentrotus purpuratus TaxID=7668 RepID=A0A7M7T1I2_STRPU|nr:uncharacterized protein LOC115926449 [Strongylocentrotus purpuratus]
MSINTEGFSTAKQQLIGKLCKENDCVALCLQETHRGHQHIRPRIPGMKLAIERPHEYGSAIFVRKDVIIDQTSLTEEDNIEVLAVNMGKLSVTSVYKPPGSTFAFTEPQSFDYDLVNVIIGDFNSHSTSWGYEETNEDGDLAEAWAEAHHLDLIHDAKLPHSFNSCRWKKEFPYDAVSIFVADWEKFAIDLDEALSDLDPVPANYDQFVRTVQEISRKHIPRGCRENYIPGLSAESALMYKEYIKLYEEDPFSEETLSAGELLMAAISEERRKSWQDLIEGVDMTHNSKRAWSTIKKISNDPKKSTPHSNVTADQVAHQLLLNGKSAHKKRHKRNPWPQVDTEYTWYFNNLELQTAIDSLKNGKAAGLDDIRTEQIKHFGHNTQEWLLSLFDNCVTLSQLPKIWRKARVIAILKPGKDPNEAKSYRPISLLCHLFKLFERLILNRLGPVTEQHLIPEQAGFRPGRSCTGQVLNLTQHVEDGFEKNEPTGVVFVDLTAAYDTVNHRILLDKLYTMTKDSHLTKLIQMLLENRRFYVELNGKRSRWRKQKNGLPQGSVLAPVLFNVYTNDQPVYPGTRSFIYADDLGIAAQNSHIDKIETTLSSALDNLTDYYNNNHLKANPAKTQVSLFHLRNYNAGRKLSLKWNDVSLKHCDHPVYLGITLDRTLSYKQHVQKVKGKVGTRNNLLRKLANSSWGANSSTLRSTALALCYSAAEYACPVWERSSHTKKVDAALNDSCRCITGCLKPTNVDSLHSLAGIAPSDVRRTVASRTERSRQVEDTRHPLYSHQPAPTRLKSRKSFLHTVQPLSQPPHSTRVILWEEKRSENHHHEKLPIPTKEQLPPGHRCDWKTWKSLNRLRTGVGRCKYNMNKWGYTDDTDTNCECGTSVQSMSHLLRCPLLIDQCCLEDLVAANEKALQCAKAWQSI